ncbi:MAG: transglutaminase-like domain-containing protein [Thermoanaerobaculia bacterium]
MIRRSATCAILAATLLAAGAARAATTVAGADRARLLPPAGVEVEPYANDGYRLSLADGVAEVRVEVEPLASTAGFAAPAGPARTPLARLARALTAGARSRYEAVSRLLSWVSANVRYDLDRARSQEPEAVLGRRSAYCTGFAALTVALLSEAGIESREVAGYVVEDLPNGPRSGYHRWVEVFYPDRGWVFSDPMATHHFVRATYLRLASDRIAGGEPGGALLLERDDRLEAIDLYPAAGGLAIEARPNGAGRNAAALGVTLGGRLAGEAVLEGQGMRRTLDLPRGRGTFLGLEPGRYELKVLQGGALAAWKQVVFLGRVHATIEVPVVGGLTGGGPQGKR